MLNRNFKTIMLGWFMSSQAKGINAPRFQTQTIYNIDGATSSYPSPSSDSDNQVGTNAIINGLNQLSTNNIIARQSQQRLFMAVGTGTTEATAEEYTLENENTDIKCETITQTYTQGYKRQITATFSNPTTQDITLKEAGLFFETYYDESIHTKTIMLARENIDITIPAGESKAITMEIG